MDCSFVHVGSDSGTPTSTKQKGALTPSSGEVRTLASASWKTPGSSVGRVVAEDRVGRLHALAFSAPPTVTKSGTPLMPRALGSRTWVENPPPRLRPPPAEPGSGASLEARERGLARAAWAGGAAHPQPSVWAATLGCGKKWKTNGQSQ
ncbi:hypothetical protein M758_UG222200 [Ceratodon purpureus]|nr:hypothetical protein M758_UG222200 [Ceratodon purpureus]